MSGNSATGWNTAGTSASGSRPTQNARRAAGSRDRRPATYAASCAATGRVGVPHHHRRLDVRVGGEHRLHLGRLDPYPVDLELVIGPADELQAPVGAPPDLVAGAVEAGAGRPVLVGHEPFGGQVRPVQIAPAQVGPTDVELADHADRHRPTVGVEDLDADVGQRAPDRHRPGRWAGSTGWAVTSMAHSVGP